MIDWASRDLVRISAWMELIWGLWVLQAPENGTARILSDLPFGAYFGYFCALHGAARWLFSFRSEGNKTLRILNWWSLANYSVFLTCVVKAQGMASMLSLLYVGYLFAQMMIVSRQEARAMALRGFELEARRRGLG